MTQNAQHMLREFDAGRLGDRIAFHRALLQAKLDYSPESLERIDALLRQMHQKLKPNPQSFLAAPGQTEFLALLAWYMGTTIARFTLQRIDWYAHDELPGVLPAEDVMNLPDCFQTTTVCVFRREDQITGYFLPLSSIGAILFEGVATESVAAAAQIHLRRAVGQPVLHAPAIGLGAAAFAADQPEGLGAALHRLGLLAGSQTAWACRTALQSGGQLAPELAQEKADGTRLINSMLFMPPEDAFPSCQTRLEEGEEGVMGAVFAYDGYINLPRFRTDALVVDARWYSPSLKVTIAVPYRNAARPDGFALFAPRVLESSFAEGYLPVLEAAFFAGIESFKPSGLWSECHADENDPDNLAARIAEQAAAAYPDTPADAAPAAPAENPFAEIRLDQIDIAAVIAARPPEEADYLRVERPNWATDEALTVLFNDIPALLSEGRVVWGQLVEANNALFEIGHDDGLPGYVLYDPTGRMTPVELMPIADALFAARKDLAALRAADPPVPELLRIVEYLEDEHTGALALPLPRPDGSGPLLVSSTYFVRRHLPGGKLILSYFPLLILDRRPGSVIVLPSRWWPQTMADLWTRAVRDRIRANWEKNWADLAGPPSEEDENYRRKTRDAIADYVRRGASDEAVGPWMIRTLPDGTRQGVYDKGFSTTTRPAPREWEWGLAGWLDSHAENLLRDAEQARARGLSLNVDLARRAFATRTMAQLINLHFLLLAERRGVSTDGQKFCPDEILWPALGLIAGCEAQARRMTAILFAAFRRPGMFFGDVGPGVRAISVLLSREFGLAPPAPKADEPLLPPLGALVAEQHWLDPDPAALAPLVEAACIEHTETAPHGPFEGLPIVIVLLFKLRAKRGLGNPAVSHPLLAAPLGDWALVDFDRCLDATLRAVRERMTKNGFNEDAIAAAVLEDAPLDAPVAFARPARPPRKTDQAIEFVYQGKPKLWARIPRKAWLILSVLAFVGSLKLIGMLTAYPGVQSFVAFAGILLVISSALLARAILRKWKAAGDRRESADPEHQATDAATSLARPASPRPAERNWASVWRSPLTLCIIGGLLWLGLFPVMYPLLAWHPISEPIPLKGVSTIETVVLIDQSGEYHPALVELPPANPFRQIMLAWHALRGHASTPALDVREIEFSLTPLGQTKPAATGHVLFGGGDGWSPSILLGRVGYYVASVSKTELKAGGYKLRVRFKTRRPEATDYLTGSIALLKPEHATTRYGDRVAVFSEERIPLANFLLALTTAALMFLLAFRAVRDGGRTLAKQVADRCGPGNAGARKLAVGLPVLIATVWLAQSGSFREGPVAMAIAFGFLGAAAYSIVGALEWAGGDRFAALAARWDRLPATLQTLLGILVITLFVAGLWLTTKLFVDR